MSTAASAFIEPTGAAPTAPEDDRRLDRWIFMAGPDIDLSRNGGSLFVGDFKDEIIRARQIVRVPRAISFGPFEIPATIMYGDETMQEGPGFTSGSEGMVPPPTTSTPDQLKGARNRYTRFENQPKTCAYILMRAHEARGLGLLEAVKGWTSEDVARVMSLFMPMTITGAWDAGAIEGLGWDLERKVFGITVRGPFLDDVREYLRQGGAAAEKLTASAMPGKARAATAEQIKAAKSTLLDMRNASDRGWSFFNTYLNNVDSSIQERRQGRPGKPAYDMPDGRFVGGVLPLDIQALANTRRDPIDVRATREQTRQMEDNNLTMLRGFELMSDKLVASQVQAMTPEHISALLDKKLAERDAEWERRIAELQGQKQ